MMKVWDLVALISSTIKKTKTVKKTSNLKANSVIKVDANPEKE